MSAFFKRTSFSGVNLNSITNCSDSCKLALREAIKAGIKEKDVRPLNKSVFTLKEQTEAIQHLNIKTTEEKTILTVKTQTVNPTSLKNYKVDLQCQVLVAGSQTSLYIDVVEWLVNCSAQKLFVFIDEENLNSSFERRISKLITPKQSNVVITSYSRLVSLEGAIKLFKHVLQVAPVSNIYFVGMDESGDAMKNMDLASRELLPELKLFVSLLCEGSSLSESRALSGLPVCCIKSNSQLQSPARILPCLASLLAGDCDNARFLYVSDASSHIDLTEVVDCQPFLPSSLQQLAAVSASVCQDSRPVFREVVTRSPGYQHVRHSLLPVFMVPGLGSLSLQPLISRLLHPVFCSSLTATFSTVEQHANILFQDIVRIQPKGPYNIVGDCWGGALALELSCLLGAAGYEVSLFLLDGAPSSAQDRLRALCERFDADLSTSLLAAVANMSRQAAAALGDLASWSEKMSVILSEVPDQERRDMEVALTCMYNQLSAVEQNHSSCRQFPGTMTLISNKQPVSGDIAGLSEFCKTKPQIRVVNVESYNELILSQDAASVINESLAFIWKM